MKNKLIALACLAATAIPSTLLAANASGYIDLGAGGGLIGQAFDHKDDYWGAVPNARIGAGVLFDSDNSTRFMGVNGHYNAYGYGDVNLAFGRHINKQVDYSFLVGADFNDKFVVPRLGADLTYKFNKHFAVSGEIAFDAAIFPSAWLSARYNF